MPPSIPACAKGSQRSRSAASSAAASPRNHGSAASRETEGYGCLPPPRRLTSPIRSSCSFGANLRRRFSDRLSSSVAVSFRQTDSRAPSSDDFGTPSSPCHASKLRHAFRPARRRMTSRRADRRPRSVELEHAARSLPVPPVPVDKRRHERPDFLDVPFPLAFGCVLCPIPVSLRPVRHLGKDDVRNAPVRLESLWGGKDQALRPDRLSRGFRDFRQ